MWKSINTVFILVILCGGFHLGHVEKLKCEFVDQSYSVGGTLYTCKLKTIDNSFDNMTIEGYTGTHLANKNDKDVKGIWINGGNTKYIPDGLGSLSNLLGLSIRFSQLIEIRSKDFQGMQNLEYLDLYGNKLTLLKSDAFSSLTKLKFIRLMANQIEHFSSELFSNNLNLVFVDLDENKIKYIGSGIFDQLMNLNVVGLRGNICVNKVYRESSAIIQMKEDIKANCVKPDDIIQYEIEHKISDESSKNREEIKALNKMMKQLLKATEDHQMERQENIKLRADQVANTKVLNEREQLIKELSEKLTEAKETIEQKLPKMEQLIEDFYMEVMDLKIERHNERQNSIALRSKLMEANEQLAECKNE